jgi:hypothetical protein
MKGSFIFDFIAIIPFEFIFNYKHNIHKDNETDKYRILKLFRLLRLARFGELLKIERFKEAINDYYNRKLELAVKNNSSENAYPIVRALFFVQIYKIFRLVVIIFTSSYFLGIIWHIMV